ncbi:hypothetical protein O181_050790 [Austropuccinia psidii MF-1]|uniref:Uncharacterized protein n=1 Tax=Austropuccinia psidii MF-1 TaxID=1389203 RepID=A0A9Q3HR77_9BASI|nr:hypothetical protein [Austropuccinia psidii MF-1]
MNWVTGLPPDGQRIPNSFLVIFDRFSNIPISLPCHKDSTAKDTAVLIWNRVVLLTGIFTNIISYRDPKLTLPIMWDQIILLYCLPPIICWPS